MAHGETFVALMAATLPLAAANYPVTAAPAGGPDTRYCLRVEPITGSRIESVQCKTRYEWSRLEVDVDQEWAENGVKVFA
jgi:hypothetical protein